MLQKIKFRYKGNFLLPIILLFLPYVGDLGKLIFEPTGKFYYVVVGLLCGIECIFRLRNKNFSWFPVYRDESGMYVKKNQGYPTQKRGGYTLSNMLLTVFALAAVIAGTFVFASNGLDNVFFGFLLLAFFLYFSTFSASDGYLEKLGLIAIGVMYAFAFGNALNVKKFDYFNPNSYALFASVLFVLTTFYTHNKALKKKKWLLFHFNFFVAFLLVEYVYYSETQMVVILFMYLIIVFRYLLFEYRILYTLFTLAIFSAVIVLPVGVAFLVNAGFLGRASFTNRGGLWLDAMSKLKEFGLFGVAAFSEDGLTPHNGFLDACFKYSALGTLLFMGAMLVFLLRAYPYIKRDDNNQLLYGAVMVFFFMNSMEAILVGLSDAYFMLLVLALLFSRVLQAKRAQAGMLKPLLKTKEPKKKKSPDEKSLGKNAFLKSVLNICNIIVPIIIGPYVLRILDREYYDQYNALNAVFQFFLIFGALGIYNYGVREISNIREDKEKCSKFFSEMFIIGGIANALVFVVYVVYAVLTAKNDTAVALSFILATHLIGNVFNVEWINEANEDYGFIAVKSIVVKLIYVVGIVLLVRQSDDILWYALLLALSVVVNMLASFCFIKKKYKFVFRGLELKKHLLPLLYIFVISNVMLLYAQLDKVMLGAFVDDASVTAYQLSQYISSIIYNVFMAIMIVSVPRIANLYAHKKKEECFRLHAHSANSFFMFMIPVAVGLSLLSAEVMDLYGAGKYNDCILPLAVYSMVQLVGSVHYIYGEALVYMAGKEKILLYINVGGGVLNFLFNLVLVLAGIFTAATAALTLAVCYVAAGCAALVYARKKLGYKALPINRHVGLYLVAAALFIPIVLLVKTLSLGVIMTAFVSFVLCAGVYVGALWLFRDGIFAEYKENILRRFKGKL